MRHHFSITPNLDIENQYPGQKISGIDEAGRGPLAGPVVAAAVILDKTFNDINDSKKLSKKLREKLFIEITNNNIYGIGIATVEEIERINILKASLLAMKRAYLNLSIKPHIVLIDGNFAPDLDDEVKTIPIIRGDSKSLSIAAASILAKVYRDAIMKDLSEKYPEYLWHQNSGYGTKFHIEAIKKYGITEHHRKTFAPIIKYSKNDFY